MLVPEQATRGSGIDVDEADEPSSKYGIEVNDARDGVLLHRVGSDREADLIVSEREWLLAERHRPHGQLLTNVASPEHLATS